MKKLIGISVLLLLLSGMNVQSQVVNKDFESKDFQTLMNSEIQVVLTGDEEYDENIKKAMEAYWDFSEYNFITKKEALYDIKDDTKSFLIPMKVRMYKETTRNGVKMTESTDMYKYWISIVIGGKKRLSAYNDNDVIALSPLNMWCGEKKPRDAGFRLDYIIKGLNEAVSLVRDNKMEGGYIKMVESSIAEINKSSSVIKDKTLIVNKDAMFVYKNQIKTTRDEVYNKKIFEKNYPYKYDFVDESEYLEILNGDSDEYLCLITIVEVNKHIHIYDPSTKKTVYYGWQMSGHKFNKGDVKDLLDGKK